MDVSKGPLRDMVEDIFAGSRAHDPSIFFLLVRFYVGEMDGFAGGSGGLLGMIIDS